ncbi:AAA family ATPase [Streptomyces omiyaensis]|uniref:AAA family ATPase n=1 Tax=Streptomyces omiyaensis TaxID=68247 RepID=UPI00227D9548|nr:ATP-binding protein [Streptomyces omiyaensis]
MGKTRLVRHSLGALDALDGRTVLWATAPPLAEPFPLGPIVDGVRCRVDRAPVGLSPLAGALRPLFPEWARLLPPPLEPLETAGATRHRLFRALAELLDRMAVDVLVLEDAHWADTATLEFLLGLTADGLGHRSLVVTYRPTEVDVVRDGRVVATVPNTGRHADRDRIEGRPVYPYRLDDTGTERCSATTAVDFTGSPDDLNTD